MGRLSERELKSIKQLGFQIRQVRLKKGWTLEEAEEKAISTGWKKCSWKHLQKIETGQKDITASTVFKLAALYSIEPGDLFP